MIKEKTKTEKETRLEMIDDRDDNDNGKEKDLLEVGRPFYLIQRARI